MTLIHRPLILRKECKRPSPAKGKSRFLRTSGKNRFFARFLRDLFCEGFAKPGEKREPIGQVPLGDIPNLNGGLFLPHGIEGDALFSKPYATIKVPDAVFDDLFTLFNHYSSMSIHAKITSEAAKKLQVQQRRSRILSIVIACLSVLLIAGILSFFALPMILTETPTIITYSASLLEDQELQEKKVTRITQRNPSAPARNQAKVIAADTMSPTAIPIPDIGVAEPSVNFGDDFDFGQGWGDDVGLEGGAASFFGQQVKAKRIAYVIDYSLSMRGRRQELMREELARSVSELPPGVLYQLIFFSGPVWVAGDTVSQRGMSANVTSGRKTYRWESKSNHFGWDSVGDDLQIPVWRNVSNSNIEESLAAIKTTRLSSGTVWLPPMQMALRLDPPPQVIYFMTDGLAGSNSNEIATEIAGLCRDQGVVVNTVSLLEPRAREAMIRMAEQTGGQAAYIDAEGEREILERKK